MPVDDLEYLDDIRRRAGIQPTEKEPKRPNRYAIILLNDDYVNGHLVMDALQTVFGFSQQAAYKFVMEVHRKGKGLVKVVPTREIAETLANKASKMTEDNDSEQPSVPASFEVEPYDED